MEPYSFLLCVYKKDDPAYLTVSIDSMLAQTVPPEEIVLVQDGPLTEELYRIVDTYTAAHPGLFTVVKNEQNIGLGKSLNVGIRHARNELLARMDADDISLPQRCELQLKAFEADPSLVIVGTSTEGFDGDPDNVVSVNHAALTQEEIYERGKRRAPFSHVSLMYRKSAVLKYGGYGDYRRAQDLDLFCRMIYDGCRVCNLPEVLVKVRKDGDMIRRNGSRESRRCVLDIRKKQWKTGYISFKDYLHFWIVYRGRELLPRSVQQSLYFKLKHRRAAAQPKEKTG